MYCFYYFQDKQTKLYYGGITSNALKRQEQHQKDLNKNLKSKYKPWHLYQDKIQLIVLWSFNTKKEACVYEKQWIINNYLNPLCLNCSISNSEYYGTTLNHSNLCESGGGHKAKIRFALEVNNPETIYIFKSSIKAENFTGVTSGNIFRGCKAANPENGKGRWLFSDVSEADLKTKFKFLEHKKLIGNKETNNSRNKKQGFKLINKKTGEISQIFYKLEEPLIYGYKIHVGNLSQCLLGNRKTVNGYQIYLT